MKRTGLILVSLAAMTLFERPLCGQAPARVFVSGNGSDSNPCTLAQPCRSFQAGVNAVGAGGEVVAKDTADYGSVNIENSVLLEAPSGVYASVSGDGITIGAGPDDVIVLRGLTITVTGEGVFYASGGELHVERCTFTAQGGDGISFIGSGKLFVKGSTFRGNSDGIDLDPLASTPTGTVSAAIEGSTFAGNGNGVTVGSNAGASVKDCVFSNNSAVGLFVTAAPGFSAQLDLERCQIANNLVGITATGGTSTARLSNCSVTGNATGFLLQTGGVILSRGNNTIRGNRVLITGGSIGSYTSR